MIRLIPAADFDFVWMIDGRERHPSRHLALPPGGVDDPIVLAWLRKLVGTLHGRGVWMIVAKDEVVGLCSYKGDPSAEGAVEIGYGIAESRRNRGFATRAVALLVAESASDPRVSLVTAETAADNIASHRVLERAGFVRTGTRICEEEGALVCWSVAVR